MAFSFVDYTKSSVDWTTSITGTWPTGATTDDIVFALIGRATVDTAPTSTPSGWTQIAYMSRATSSPERVELWYRVKTTGESNPVWSWASNDKTVAVLAAYRDGFDTNNPIYDYSNTEYITSNTILRAASVGAIDGQPIIFFGMVYSTVARSFTQPSGYSENVDDGDVDCDLWSIFASIISSSTGETGDIDATISATATLKHAFAVVLAPVPNACSIDGEFPMPVFKGEFWKNDAVVSGEFPMPSFLGYFDAGIADLPASWLQWACDSFGNDTITPAIWEREFSDYDLTPGDGVTPSTYPTFNAYADGIAFYVFDGIDDYVSNWPIMPDDYTVSAALSDSYPDGQPYISQCNDDTVEVLLTTPSAFAGNLHNLVIFDSELTIAEKQAWAEYQLRHLWRDTFVDPFTARRIRDGDIELALYCEEESDRFDDYSLNAIGYTDYSTVFSNGLTFPTSGAALVMDSEQAVNLEVLSIFLESPNFDLEASADTILQNGTNYVLSIALSAGTCTLTLNGSDFSFTSEGYRTLGITVRDGEKPKFYLNGRYAGDGDAVATVDSAGAGQLTIGNNTARNNPFASTLKKLFIDSQALNEAEIKAMHFGAMAERTWS